MDASPVRESSGSMTTRAQAAGRAPLVEFRVRVEDTNSAPRLVERFRRAFGSVVVSFDQQLNEVCVQVEREFERARVIALATLEAWLHEDAIGPATLRSGEHSYALSGRQRRTEEPIPLFLEPERNTGTAQPRRLDKSRISMGCPTRG